LFNLQNWPLSTVQIKKLPSFLKKKNSISTMETAPPRRSADDLSSAAVRDGIPRPPPRVKKAAPQVLFIGLYLLPRKPA
jgi:hypothetical protein